jgi:signal transduction histidine kinase
MGGQITVTDNATGGTTVIISLPSLAADSC